MDFLHTQRSQGASSCSGFPIVLKVVVINLSRYRDSPNDIQNDPLLFPASPDGEDAYRDVHSAFIIALTTKSFFLLHLWDFQLKIAQVEPLTSG